MSVSILLTDKTWWAGVISAVTIATFCPPRGTKKWRHNFVRFWNLRTALEQVTGFEPVLSAWQAEVLTTILYLHLNLGRLPRLVSLVWFMRTRDSQTYPLEPVDGLEPPTYWLQISCAANCAIPAYTKTRIKSSRFLLYIR